MDIGKKIRGMKKLINNGAIIDSVDVLILIKEIEKQRKMIELMAYDRYFFKSYGWLTNIHSPEDVIKHYERKAKENERK
jgi:hypothetical protein